jgi:hypothetical protein
MKVGDAVMRSVGYGFSDDIALNDTFGSDDRADNML